jgi:hypothetical protein
MGDTPPYEGGTLDVEPALDAIRRTVELCRNLGIEYVLVRLPEHTSRFAGENAVYRQYGERLAAFAQRENIRYLDVVGGDVRQWSDDGMFNDAAHLTEPAAEYFTTKLARAWLAATP